MMAVGSKVVSMVAERKKRLGGPAHFLGRHDPRWDCRSVIELATESYDPDTFGIGSSPWDGDTSGMGCRVPPNPTRFQSTRYLFRLLQAEIDLRRAIVIRGLWQWATIRATPSTRAPNCRDMPVELEITSPGWRFVDGNISWHLRWETNRFSPESIYDPNQIPGTSPSLSGQDAALLYLPPFLPYKPPGSGIPPGTAVDFLGTWREMRYLNRSARQLEIPVMGPGRVTLYASVHQTDTLDRCPITVPVGIGRPEDQFVAAYEEIGAPVVYGHVGAGLAVEIFPCCDDLPKGSW